MDIFMVNIPNRTPSKNRRKRDFKLSLFQGNYFVNDSLF